jgi:hypothetical protein
MGPGEWGSRVPAMQLQQRQPAAPSGAGDPAQPDLGERAALAECVGELRACAATLDEELRTRQLAAARDTLRAMAVLVAVLDGVVDRVRLCRCGRVREPSSATCWRCG